MMSASCLNGYSTIDLEFPATTVRVTIPVKQRVGRAPKHYRQRDHRIGMQDRNREQEERGDRGKAGQQPV